MVGLDTAVSTGANHESDLRRRNVPDISKVHLDSNRTNDEDVKKARTQSPSFLHVLANWEPIIAPILLTALALFTRLYQIGRSNIVTWDEAHFGKFGSHYLKREFYFDVHPPLGKMLVGLSGYLAGYNGSFEFKSGEKYPEDVNYTFMRAFNAAFGIICIPLAYYTARELNFRRPTVWLISLMVLCENSYATISRFILLDSMLLCFTFTTTMCWARFHRLQRDSFSLECVKWVGFFCTALVGLYTIDDLWNKFGDLKMPRAVLAKHLVARVVGLIVIPILVYMFSFYLHFLVLANSGPGDAQMSSLFQANLQGTEVGRDSPLELAIGSRVTLKNMGYGGGLLHSHVQTYPEGSMQQQVTCYHHKDANNDWFIYPNRQEPDYDATADLRFVGDGDVIRLIHGQTGRNLHSHAIPAPITKSHHEVSSYGNITIGDDKDHWKVEVVDDVASWDRSRIRTLTTAFRLRHPVLGCYLRAGNVNLPQWGFKQIETTCTKENKPGDVYTHWNVESHTNDRLPPGDPGSYKSPFLKDFIHLNVAMMTSNNALVPDPDKQDDLASKFWQWPILNVGLRMCSWDDSVVKYYLLGNPLVYWGSTAALGGFGLLFIWYLLRWQRGYNDLSNEEISHIHYSGIYPVIGWVLHYLPFIIMARVTYVHHYYPALYYAILNFGFCVDWVTRKMNPRLSAAVYAFLYVVIVGLFIHFRAIVFGMEGSNQQWSHLRWLPGWKMANVN
ncbi:CAZyme family GT39 [Penicillium roqueforti]|uniref:CAZyme family GT39 n=1 Tax=Penicillium roqueforti TaxID=5082 RepID=UPI00190C0BEF|nr:CAZyme family GT39 [Penicillium roqueforti]KAF9244067.1 CAZyme family GT39 [Penicillium roqueforti]KAI2670324.1 CAZyme family GT39 [Penicillium roqueforti]KAI2672764.1 CAZyme family GT39 [Penicillium roqueforti]KAI2695091.1 CAZyme family GT39 [Penicillium roqueforti]KAI2708005.1 CAZyme family GT39 [Penicillium roqueforti]